MDDATRPDGLTLASDRETTFPSTPLPRNTPVSWNIPDMEPEEVDDSVQRFGALVSFHYLRAAVRRRWLLCAVMTILGLLTGMGFLVAAPPMPKATTTLLLSHDSQVDPIQAAATDLSLLATRTVAEQTISALRLSMTPAELMTSLTTVPSTSSQILQLTMTAPTNAEADRRLTTFSQQYLQFRAQQVTAQSKALVLSYDNRIAALQSQVTALSAQIQTLTASGRASDQLDNAMAQRGEINNQIGTLQQAEQDAAVRQSAVVAASRVIDPAAIVPSGGLRSVALVLASFMMGGCALGITMIVLQAILSDRLRLRVEVSSALNTPVPLSVRQIAPLPFWMHVVRFLPGLRTRDERRSLDRLRLARLIERSALQRGPGRSQSLAVVCLGNSADARFAVAVAAMELQAAGHRTTIVDLTQAENVASALAWLSRGVSDGLPDVVRPDPVPSVTGVPSSTSDDLALVPQGGIKLIVADFNPAVGVDYLAAWSDRVILTVTSGQPSVEHVRTAGDLVRTADLELHGAILLRALRDDVTSGMLSGQTNAAERNADETSGRGPQRPEMSAGRAALP